MRKHAIKSTRPQLSSSPLSTALHLVSALTGAQLNNLHDFARRRLSSVSGVPHLKRGLARLSADDLFNTAVEQVLLADVVPGKGRRLRPRNRHSPKAFLNYLRGIIDSLISNTATCVETLTPHLRVGNPEFEPDTVDVPDPVDYVSLLAHRDLQQEFFRRFEPILKRQPALRPVVEHWQRHFLDSDQIAGPDFDAKLTYRVRQHARSILRGMGFELPGRTIQAPELFR